MNFSLGLAQVNRYNLGKYGLDSYEKGFEPCANLTAGSKILAECYHRAGGDWGKSFSCYYSGNFSTGFRHGYVQKIYASLREGRASGPAADGPAIEVVGREEIRTAIGARAAINSSASATPRAGATGKSATTPAAAGPRGIQRTPERAQPGYGPSAAAGPADRKSVV